LRRSDRPIHDRPPDEIGPLDPAWNNDERVCLVEAD